MRDAWGANRFLERYFWIVVTLLALAAVSLELTSALQETQTWDEGIHISAGYAYWTRGDFRWNQEHPPLAKLVCSLPLLALPLRLPVGSEGWRKLDETQMGIDFLYRNRAGADEILIAARSMNMLLSGLFLFAVAWLARRTFGSVAALLAVTLCAFDPNLIAHARYVTTDFPVTVFLFLTALLWMEYLTSCRLRDLILASVALALALATKFSAFLLLPSMAILYVIRWRQMPSEFPLRRAATACAFLAATSLVVVSLLYGQETLDSFSAETPALADVVERGNPTGEVLYTLGRWFHLPAHPFLTGLAEVAAHNHEGHASYLLGMHSDQGWWYYFPVVFAVKSTITALIAIVLLLAGGVAGRKRWRQIPFFWYGLLIPPLVYFVLSMTSGIDIGVRHILPVYPFLYLGVAVLLSRAIKSQASGRRWARLAMVGLACLQIAECAWIAPDYLAFFNALVGGPGNGPRYLVDSNIDWGQDVKKLKKWLKAHGTNTARVWYFGNAQMDYYGIYADAFPDPLDQKGWDAINGYGVASVTVLEGVYVPLNTVAPLRLKEPMAKVGWSMYVYDLRKGRR
ncbi:MAG: glycosyltransferase family 39 protein [Acidobacteriia bacterium]|nr:glycosyltransferase family 39 protein [Terriglobia bacterium]